MAGKKIKTMEEFALISGLSRPTVSKYFQDPSSVRRSTRQQIEAALEKYDYHPNIYAINQNRQMTKSIGVVVPYLTDPFFAEIARKIEQAIIAAHFRPILLNSSGDPRQEADHLSELRAIKPAGALLAPLGRGSNRDALEAFADEVPTVLFDSRMEEIGGAFIGSNNSQSVGLIVDHLCQTGAPPAFFEMRTPTNPNADTRRDAYVEAMARRGETPILIQAEGSGWDFEEIGFREGGRLLKERGFGTDAILCSNDRLAIGLLSAAYELGLRVGAGPRCALRIAGHDDHPFARYTSPALTTVSQDYAAIARTSVKTLFRLIEAGGGPAAPASTLFDGTLILRASA